MKVRLKLPKDAALSDRLEDVHAVPRTGDRLVVTDVDGRNWLLLVEEVHHLALYSGKPDIAAELYCREV